MSVGEWYGESIPAEVPTADQIVAAFRDALGGVAGSPLAIFLGLMDRDLQRGEWADGMLVCAYRKIANPACRTQTELAWLLHWNLCRKSWLWAETLHLRSLCADGKSHSLTECLSERVAELGLPVRNDLAQYVDFFQACYRPGGCFADLRSVAEPRKTDRTDDDDRGESAWGLPVVEAVPVRLVLFAILFFLTDQLARRDGAPVAWLRSGVGSPGEALGLQARPLDDLVSHLSLASSIADEAHLGLLRDYDYPHVLAHSGSSILVIGIALLAVAALATLILAPEIVPLEYEAVALVLTRVPMPVRVGRFLEQLEGIGFRAPRAPWPFRPFGRTGIWTSRFANVSSEQVGRIMVPAEYSRTGAPIPVVDPEMVPYYLARALIRRVPPRFWQWWRRQRLMGRQTPWPMLSFPFGLYWKAQGSGYVAVPAGPIAPKKLPETGEPNYLYSTRDGRIAYGDRMAEIGSPWEFMSLLDLDATASMYPSQAYFGKRSRWTPEAAQIGG